MLLLNSLRVVSKRHEGYQSKYLDLKRSNKGELDSSQEVDQATLDQKVRVN